MKEKEEDIYSVYDSRQPEFFISIAIESIDEGCRLIALKKALSILEKLIHKEEALIKQKPAIEEFKKICPGFDENNCTYAEAMQFNAFLKKNGYE
jgi:hypothetical protein